MTVPRLTPSASGAGVATAGTTTNIVSSTLSIGGLVYSNNGAANTHTTQINSGTTLSVVPGAGPFTMGSAGTTKVSFTGGGTLSVTDMNHTISPVAGGVTTA